MLSYRIVLGVFVPSFWAISSKTVLNNRLYPLH